MEIIICDMDTLTDYPHHLYEPIRRQIAESFVQHELRKLLPSLRDQSIWESIDGDVAQWFQNSPTLLPMRDFWNGFEGISAGFKLKNLTSHLTSKNMRWSETQLPIQDLWFGTTFGHFEKVGEMPQAKTVADFLQDAANQDILEKMRSDLHRIDQYTAPRDQYPVIVTFIKSRYRVVDGNRRLLKLIVEGQENILSYLGEAVGEPDIFEQWVPTQILLNLSGFHRYQSSLGNDITGASAWVLAEIIKDSQAGQNEWLSRCLSHSDAYDIRLWQAVKDIFKSWGKNLGEMQK